MAMSSPQPTQQRRSPHPNSLANLKLWKPGQSGNPAGRPKLEPRIRKRARRYDTRIVAELWAIGSDPKVDADVRRRCLMDLQALGNGRPPTTQELVPGAKGNTPLVNINLGAQQPGSSLDPAAVYRLMCEGHLDADPAAFERPAIEAPTSQEAPE